MKKWGFLITGADGESVFTEAEVVPKAKADALQKALNGLFGNPHMNLEDAVYDVREREGEGWEGKWVEQWSEAVLFATAHVTETIKEESK